MCDTQQRIISRVIGNLVERPAVEVPHLCDGTLILSTFDSSRHISRTTYRCFLRYKPNSVGISGLTHYFCECANGQRTVGCCSHIAAILYYLSHTRYLSRIFRPAEILSDVFKKSDYVPVIESDIDKD